MNKIFDLIKTERKVQIYLAALAIALLYIHPMLSVPKGVYVQSVSSPVISGTGIESVQKGDIITSINGFPVGNLSDYIRAYSNLKPGDKITLQAKRESQTPYFYRTINAYPYLASENLDNSTNLGIKVSEIPSSHLDFGLDISGGTEILLQPAGNVSDVEFQNIVDVLRQRLNLFGLKDIPVRGITDISGQRFIKAEFGGLSSDEAIDLISREGKFEAKIGNTTAFTGADILSVCITGVQCTSVLQPYSYQNEQGQAFIGWNFMFQIDISQDAAKNFALITENLSQGECDTDGQCYLNETMTFFIDDEPIAGSSLRISEELKGKSDVTSPVITGARTSREEALNEKRKLQAILQSRSLPVKINIVRTNTISPLLGEAFAQNLFMVFVLCILIVDGIILLRYRKFTIALPIMIIALSEIIMTLGAAVAIGWTLDIASIAGVLAAVGTGIDDQIIITDEVLRGEKEEFVVGWKKKLQKAFFVVMAAFTINSVTMLPLLFGGAGLLRGFAITTLIGLSLGVFITRPAYASIIEKLLK